MRATEGPLSLIYDEFRSAEQRNFFEAPDELESFLARPGTMDAYLRGEYGINHIYKVRTEAFLFHFEEIARIAQQAIDAELRARDLLDPLCELYLNELLEVALSRRTHLTDTERVVELTLHFDFPTMHSAEYLADPRLHFIPNGRRFIVYHTETQKADLEKYFVQYEDSGGIRPVPSPQRQPHPLDALSHDRVR